MPSETETKPQEQQREKIPSFEGITDENEAVDDAALDKILGPEPEAEAREEESPEISQETDPASVIKEDTSGNKEEGESVKDVEGKESEDSGREQTEEPSDVFRRAMHALKRDRVPQEILDKMADENPRQFIEWGLGRADAQGKVDGFGQRLSDLEGRLEDGEETEGAEETSGRNARDSQPAADIQHLVPLDWDKITEPFNEVIGEEAADPLKKFGQAILDKVQREIHARDHFISGLMQLVENRELSFAKKELGDRFPQLNTEDGFAQVGAEMKKLLTTGEYTDIPSLMADAARISFSDTLMDTRDRRRSESHRMKNQGQVDMADQIRPTSRSKSVDEKEDAALDAILKGLGPGAAEKAYNE